MKHNNDNKTVPANLDVKQISPLPLHLDHV